MYNMFRSWKAWVYGFYVFNVVYLVSLIFFSEIFLGDISKYISPVSLTFYFIVVYSSIIAPVYVMFFPMLIQDETLEYVKRGSVYQRSFGRIFFYFSRLLPLLVGVPILISLMIHLGGINQTETTEVSGTLATIEKKYARRARTSGIYLSSLHFQLNDRSGIYTISPGKVYIEQRDKVKHDLQRGDSLYIRYAVKESTGEYRTVYAMRSPKHGTYLDEVYYKDTATGSVMISIVIIFISTVFATVFTTSGGRFWETPAMVLDRESGKYGF